MLIHALTLFAWHFGPKAQFELACRSLMAGCMQAGMHAGAAPWMGDGMQMGASAHPAPAAPPGQILLEAKRALENHE